MKIRDFYDKIFNDCWRCYGVGFVNSDGREDETELIAYDLSELEELYEGFCEENQYPIDTVEYIEPHDHTLHVEFDVLVEDALAEDVKDMIKRGMIKSGDDGVLRVHNMSVQEVWDDLTFI